MLKISVHPNISPKKKKNNGVEWSCWFSTKLKTLCMQMAMAVLSKRNPINILISFRYIKKIIKLYSVYGVDIIVCLMLINDKLLNEFILFYFLFVYCCFLISPPQCLNAFNKCIQNSTMASYKVICVRILVDVRSCDTLR